MGRTPPGTPKRKPHTFSLDPQTVERLREHEAKTGASMSRTIDLAVAEYLDRLNAHSQKSP